MNRPLIRVFFVAIVGVIASAARADEPPFIPNQVVVQLRPGASITAFNARFGSTLLDSITQRRIHLLSIPANTDEASFIDDVEEDPDIERATLNGLVTDAIAGGSTQSIFLRTYEADYDSNTTINQINAHLPSVVQPGRNVLVAILDTGADLQHPRLQGKFSALARDLILNQPLSGDPSTSTDSNNNGLFDEFTGHGTHICGLVARIAPAATLLPIRVMDSDGTASVFDVADGLYYAIDHGATLINLSMGFPADAFFLNEAVNEVIANGIVLVAATGNHGQTSAIDFPAAYPGVVAVAAIDAASIRLDFSNVSPEVSIAAPGFDITSTTPNGEFAQASGTSFATPLVTGSLAVLMGGCVAMSASDAKTALFAASLDLSAQNPNHAGLLGAGLPQLGASLASASCQSRCPADLDNGTLQGIADGGVDSNDITFFFGAFEVGDTAVDINQSGAVDSDDIVMFFHRWDSGC